MASSRVAWGACILLAASITLASCAERERAVVTDRELTEAAAAINDIQLEAVISAPESDWIYGHRPGEAGGRLYRFATSGSLTEQTELPDYHAAFATSLGGHLYVGGMRCGNSNCGTTVVEANRLTESGKIQATIRLAEEESDPSEASGVSLVGALDDNSLLFATSRGLLRLGADDNVELLSLPEGVRQVCPIGGEVFSFGFPSEDAAGVIQVPAAGQPHSRAVSIDVLRDGGLTPVANGSREFTLPAPLNVNCSDGMIIARSGNDVRAQWTPRTGWVDSEDDTEAASTVGLSSRRAWYALDETGRLRPADSSALPVSLQFTPPTPGLPPPSLAIDDSGGHVFACVQYVSSNSDAGDPPATECNVGDV